MNGEREERKQSMKTHPCWFLTAESDVFILHEYEPSVARFPLHPPRLFPQEKPEIYVVNVKAPDF